MRKTLLALLVAGLLAPAVAGAQPNDGGAPPLPDGGLISGADGPRGKGAAKDERQPDDSGSQGAPGGAPSASNKSKARSHVPGGSSNANP